MRSHDPYCHYLCGKASSQHRSGELPSGVTKEAVVKLIHLGMLSNSVRRRLLSSDDDAQANVMYVENEGI
jgi:hypothetical protein